MPHDLSKNEVIYVRYVKVKVKLFQGHEHPPRPVLIYDYFGIERKELYLSSLGQDAVCRNLTPHESWNPFYR